MSGRSVLTLVSRRCVPFCVFLPLALLIAPPGALGANPASDGKKFEKEGNYEAAYKCYQEAYAEKKSEKYLEAIQRLGKIVCNDRYRKTEKYWQETQDIDGSLAKLEEALKFDPANSSVLSLQQRITARKEDALGKLRSALASSEGGRHDTALKDIKFAALVYPTHEPIQEAWLQILKAAVRGRIQQADFVKGAELLKEAAEKWDESQVKDIMAEFHLAVGKALVQAADYKSALDACAKAEALVPDLAGLDEIRKTARDNLAGQLERDGREYVAQKKWKLAVDNFSEAFGLNPAFEGIQERIRDAQRALAQELLEKARSYMEQRKPANALLRHIAASVLVPDSDELTPGVASAKKAIEDRVTFRVGIRGFEDASANAELPSRLANELLDYLFQKSLDTLQIVDVSGEQWAAEVAERTGTERELKKPISVFIDGSVYPVKKETRKVVSAQGSQLQVGTRKVPNPEYSTIVASQSAIIRAVPELGQEGRSAPKAASDDILANLLRMAEVYQSGKGEGKGSSSLDKALKTLSALRSSSMESAKTYSTGQSSGAGSLGQALGMLAAMQSSRAKSSSSGVQAQRIAAALSALESLRSQPAQPVQPTQPSPAQVAPQENVALRPSTIETLKAIAQEDNQRKVYALAKRELGSLDADLRKTPTFIDQPVYASTQSGGGETHFKTAMASCYVKIREFRTGKLVFSRRFSKTHTVTDRVVEGNPQQGIVPDPLELPSDIQMEEEVISGLFSEVSASLFDYLRNYGAGYLMLAQREGGDAEGLIERQLDYLFSYTARDNPGQVRDAYMDLRESLKVLLPRTSAPKVPSALEEFLGAMPGEATE